MVVMRLGACLACRTPPPGRTSWRMRDSRVSSLETRGDLARMAPMSVGATARNTPSCPVAPMTTPETSLGGVGSGWAAAIVAALCLAIMAYVEAAAKEGFLRRRDCLRTKLAAALTGEFSLRAAARLAAVLRQRRARTPTVCIILRFFGFMAATMALVRDSELMPSAKAACTDVAPCSSDARSSSASCFCIVRSLAFARSCLRAASFASRACFWLLRLSSMALERRSNSALCFSRIISFCFSSSRPAASRSASSAA
mmetsp:Transcript_130738/g.194817  ORF Transcript_130738/g.194817 Transcript_130738/m.194817 type:complete len:256 (+) Transcript_130738:96-863(+)